ncbi:hypothetical protein EC9_07480 [Rosistilla ulvae]|uniref:Pilus formation protein N-terminal domain-containing protein n=1 Tax=Rosistilla ulvae TaxID=1930277 RepID=A0A517LVD4_9BACT|nr:pilus assembly protein N-terminal domain-containing protein [Rosistilla ulvae]QDS86581.1 hypothetical protein EC9_07480 [Rosistilla ulvae]
MRWPKRRCLARHLRRAALVSLITASSNGLSIADQPQAKHAPVQQNHYAAPTITGSDKGQVTQPRIIAFTAADQVAEDALTARTVQLIESRVHHNPLAIVQTAGPEAKSESAQPLKFRMPSRAADVPAMIVDSPSTLDLRGTKVSPLEQPSARKSRSVLSLVPQSSKPAGESDSGVSFSISDDSLTIPSRPPEATPVDLVRPGGANVVDVVEAPTMVPLRTQSLVEEPQGMIVDSSDARPSAKVPVANRPIWKLPNVRPLEDGKHADNTAGRDAENLPRSQPIVLGKVGNKQQASQKAGASVPLPSAKQGGHAPVDGLLAGEPKRKSELAESPKAVSLKATPRPEIVKESKVVRDVPKPAARPKPNQAADRAVVAIKSTIDPAASLVTRSQFTVSVAESRVLFAGNRIVRVSVEHPDVCNAVTTGKECVMVVGRKLGRTRVAIWTDSTANLEPDLYVVEVDGEQGETEDQQLAGKMTVSVASMFSGAQVKVHAVEDGFVVSGAAETETQARKIMQVVRSACLRRVRDELVVR